MKVHKISYNDVSALSFKDLSYINLDSYLKDFYAYHPLLDNFEKAISDRKKCRINRNLLVGEFKAQYAKIEATDLQIENINSLQDEDTFTIITAHQPSLFGGPLYYILKICSIINLCNQLKKKYPSKTFIPTFISGGEDHDFDEIDHLHLYGKSLKWERKAEGPVGRLNLEGIPEVISQLEEILGENIISNRVIYILKESFSNSKNYGEFVFRFVNCLFGKYGLLTLNMDKPDLKRAFIPAMRRELIDQPSKKNVLKTQNKLDQHHFKAQAFPRDINLFYLGLGGRDRIESKNGNYQIVNTNKTFTQKEILKELDEHPENFSPNVVLRPLYQESILPNLAYVGGGGEIAYWLERKAQFEEFGVFYPMLIRRNSALIVNRGMQKNIQKLGFEITDIFKPEHTLVSELIERSTDNSIDLEQEKNRFSELYQSIATKSKAIDPTLSKSILAEMTKTLKSIDQMESRMKRSIKSREEINVNKIGKLKEKLFPNNGLQERYDNFIPHYISIGESFFDILIENLNPMDRRFTIFLEE